MLSDKDKKQIAQKGISEEKLREEFEQFKTGFPFLKLEVLLRLVRVSMSPLTRNATSTSVRGRSTRTKDTAS